MKADMCGDAAGRPDDFSDSDRAFAVATGLKFFTPEQLFGPEAGSTIDTLCSTAESNQSTAALACGEDALSTPVKLPYPRQLAGLETVEDCAKSG